MKLFIILTITLTSVFGVFGQTKETLAEEVKTLINSGKVVKIENATVIGNLDLTNLSNQENDSSYYDKEKTVKVFSNKISAPIFFKNVKFTGNLNFFRKEYAEKEVREYRVVFENSVVFENCVFENETNFELTNFNDEVSFVNSVFKKRPLLIRLGIEKTPNLTGTVFEQGSVFQFTQNDAQLNLSVNDLRALLNHVGKR